MWRFRIQVLSISILSKTRLFYVKARSPIEAGGIAATILFGKPFIEWDFQCKHVQAKFLFEGWWMSRNSRKFRITHKRMDSLKAEVQIQRLQN